MDELTHKDCTFTMDGDMVCCQQNGFTSLMEDPAGYGTDDDAAFEDLLENRLK